MLSLEDQRKNATIYLPADPFHAIEVAFGDDRDIAMVTREIQIWFFMAVSQESAKFYEHKEREGLGLLVFNLLYLAEIMYFQVEFQKVRKEDKNLSIRDAWNKIFEEETPYWVDIAEIKDPIPWLISFTKDYSLDFIRNELWIFFDAVQFYKGPLIARICPEDTHNTWQVLTCITEAAYIVTSMRYKDLKGETNEPAGPSGYVSPKQIGT